MFIILIRVLLIYILIIASLRLMGKRQLGQLQPSELVVTILVSNIATMSIEDPNIPLLGGIIPILSLVSFDVIISVITLKSKTARRIVSGTPRVIIRDGKIDQSQLKTLRFTIDDLMEQLRIAGYFDIRDISSVVVETTGQLSIYPKFSAQPVTAEMMQLPDTPVKDAPPAVVISDGIVMHSALRYCNLKEEWLENILKEHGYHIGEIFLMTCDRQAKYLIVPKEKISKKKKGGACA